MEHSVALQAIDPRWVMTPLNPGRIDELPTFNISAAYHIIPVHPDQQNFTCIHWKEEVYVDQAACFSLASSAGVFGLVWDHP